jgi:thiamine transport system ATP-binding protein
MTAGLVIERLTVGYDDKPAVLADVSFTVAPGEVVALLGPSGSGKSTLLLAIAGHLHPTAGRLFWDGVDLAAVPAHDRHFGLVLQDPLLFPHLDVADNVAYGLRRTGQNKTVARQTASGLLAWAGLEGLDHRDPATLSGGQAQRVAVVRALAPEPRLLLLDEPFSALDGPLRRRLAADVRRQVIERGVPTLHVTHDEAEAESIADRVVSLAELTAQSV